MLLGEYIGFIDSDDVIAPNFYECLYNLILETNSDIAECASVQITEDDLFSHNYKFDFSDTPYITTDRLGALHRIHSEDVYIVGKSLVVWNKLYKRSLWNLVQFPVGKRYEDDLTTYKVFNEITKLVSTQKVLYNYVQRNNSIMHQPFSLKRLDALYVFDEHVNFFKTFSDKYLFSKCLVRYLRILSTLLEELCQSDYENKDSVKKILKSKFEEVSFMLTDILPSLSSNQYDYIKETEKIHNEKFYSLLK